MNEHVKTETIEAARTGKEQQARQGPSNLFFVSFLLVVVLPSIIAGAYYIFVAADQYAVEVRFAVRGPEGNSTTDILSLATGTGSANSTTTDAYILMDYLRSRQLLEDLSTTVNFESIFNAPEADVLTAFPVKDRPIEKFVDHWKDMVRIDFDTTSTIIILELRSFTPQHSLQLAQETLKRSEKLINRLSERSRQDALRGANEEVARQEERMRLGLVAMRRFREKSQDIDPAQSAAAQLTRLSELETKLNSERTTLSTQRTFMSDKSPAIQFTKSKIKALQQQVSSERSKLGQGAKVGKFAKLPKGTLSGRVQDFQALTTEMEFAQKAYLQSLISLEQARLTANKQQRYLATFVAPSLPQYAIYPLRWVNTLIVLFLCLGIWVVGLLVVYGIRDHAL